MHEYSLVHALVSRVEELARENHAEAVQSLELEVGELAGVEVELLKLAFETFRAGTVCAGAELSVTTAQPRWECPRCGPLPATPAALHCPACGRAGRLAGGDQILLQRIAMEVPAHV